MALPGLRPSRPPTCGWPSCWVFASPTVGFLVGWPFAAFVTGLIVERWQGRLALVASVASVVGGIVVLYVFGVVGMSITLGKTIPEAALLVTAFIPGDVLKAVLAGLITSGLARSRPSSVLSRG